MREIKFRAWANGERAKVMFSWEEYRLLICGWINDAERNVTLMQFTGLKDKNGKEIYEGDILEIARDDGSGVSRDVVEWSDLHCGWALKTLLLGVAALHQNRTVIGNIHENPELLTNN